MMLNLFTLDGPLCAIETGGARETSLCETCGRGRRTQRGDLSLSLVCRPRHVWVSDANAVLVDDQAANALRELGLEGIGFRTATADWRDGIPSAGEAPLSLVQIVASNAIAVSIHSASFESCFCGAVRSISFEPLVVVDPSSEAGAWHLTQNPEVLVFDARVCDVLSGLDADLEWLQVWRESEYPHLTTPSGGVSWDDL